MIYNQIPINVPLLKKSIIDWLEKKKLNHESDFLRHIGFYRSGEPKARRHVSTRSSAKARWTMEDVMYRTVSKELWVEFSMKQSESKQSSQK